MAVKRIRQLGDPVLWRKSVAVADPAAASVAALAEDLRDTLMAFRREHGYGRGIAAPQVGVLERVVLVDAPASDFSCALVNPEIVRRSDERVLVWDACFSLPGLMIEVPRSAGVVVEYLDLSGVRQTVDASGELSELLQHEIDHLEGVLALDRAAAPHSVWCTEEWQRQQRGV